jgi:3-methylcrotonyl-CoA carboxylase alpha subunit
MGRAAVEAARAIGYRGAGTVEFIADGSGPLRADGFWFMEMNTRLQVEHPVTEAITGLDLVALQLRVAAGEPLPFAQDDLGIDGHAFEARIYAEDVGRGFIPAPGRLEHLATPDAAEFAPGPVRIDSGVREGDEITPHYDPMIAKLVVHAPSRAEALIRLRSALRRFRVAGAVTNLGFLTALAGHDGFAAGDVDTGLIARDLDALTAPAPPPDVAVAVAALTALGLVGRPAGDDPWSNLAGWRHWSEAKQYAALVHGERRHDCLVVVRGEGRYSVDGGAGALDLRLEAEEGSAVTAILHGRLVRAHVVAFGRSVVVFLGGASYCFGLPDLLVGEEAGDAAGDLVTAPMPGLVTAVTAVPGLRVAKGEALMALEAMKMEHALTAPRDGVVAEVLARPGDQVADGAVLVALEPEGDGSGDGGAPARRRNREAP